MELLRTIAYPPGGGGAKCCEVSQGRAAGGESRRKKAEEQPHQHAHPAAEVSRIITDPTTGKRYCRGKVLGKVMAAAGFVPSRGGGRCAPARPPSFLGEARCGLRALPQRGCFPPDCVGERRAASPRPARSGICFLAQTQRVQEPFCSRFIFAHPLHVESYFRGEQGYRNEFGVACGTWGGAVRANLKMGEES